MNFDYTDEQEMLKKLCMDIAKSYPDEYWQNVDEESCFPGDYNQVLADQGLLGIAIPEEYGGSGLGMLDLVMAVEALAEHGVGMDGTAHFVSGPIFAGILFTGHGTEKQKQAYLPGVVNGEIWAGAFTEPNTGSNITNIKSRATLDGNVYRINGQKTFISQMKNAKHIVIMARTSPYDEQNKTRGVSLLVGDLPSPQISYQPFKKMGSHCMDTNSVFIEDYEVPRENLIGEAGKAWKPMFDVLNTERLCTAATAVGTGNLAIKKAVQFAQERSIWGVPLATHQGLQFPLAKARTELAAAKLKLYEAAWLYDQKRECGIQTAMAKYSAAHAGLFAADTAIQTMGGSGYIKESGVERHWRNLRLLRLAPISDEMVLNYIAQNDLNMPRSY